MIDKFLTKVFGSSNQRYLKTLQPIVAHVNELEADVKRLTDDEMRARIAELREQVANQVGDIAGRDERAREERKRRTQEALDRVLPEVFALTREASVRSTGMRHFDVQIIGGIALHQGRIAEMRTGEGKTLVATLPATLNALTGRGVHVVTVNDYLATRDAEWMGRIYKFLGLSVGAIVNDLDDWERKDAYAADITYGTNNEFGFDYLRDNMKFDLATCVQRSHFYAVVDEVDSILIDEARTPLIISGASDEATEDVKIERENQTLATITLQNYFRLYDKLAGMTGTAETEAAEFDATYKLEVAVIPTNQPMVRKDNSDVIYRTLPEKWDAVVEEIVELHEKGQPVLVGTVSVENSELISRRLTKAGIRHADASGNVLIA